MSWYFAFMLLFDAFSDLVFIQLGLGILYIERWVRVLAEHPSVECEVVFRPHTGDGVVMRSISHVVHGFKTPVPLRTQMESILMQVRKGANGDINCNGTSK
jgi:hypothetical protein